MDFDEKGAREFLEANKWPSGLINTFLAGLKKCPIRFFICDDSGSMMTQDGEVAAYNAKGKYNIISCTRWKELTQTLQFHLNLTKSAGVESEFRLLNGVCEVVSPHNLAGIARLNDAFAGSPSGGTPLCRHIIEVTQKIQNIAPILRSSGQKAVLVIATDGESSDGDVREVLRPLKDLPVWVVVRLCTNEEKIVNYWNSIDSELELDMDVLDDMKGEAEEISKFNPWLTYGEPIHRLREFGIITKDFDLLDEAKLSADQIRDVIAAIFGNKDQIPQPQLDFDKFCKYIDRVQSSFSPVYDPLHKKAETWIKLNVLRKQFGKGDCNIM